MKKDPFPLIVIQQANVIVEMVSMAPSATTVILDSQEINVKPVPMDSSIILIAKVYLNEIDDSKH